jgi:Nitrile hydratase beta subunit
VKFKSAESGVRVARPGYDRWMERAVHDRGGWPTETPIDRSEHELEDWELHTDALVRVLNGRGLIEDDELRRGIESMPADAYEHASYYERWLYSVETILTEKGVLEPGELDRRLTA